MLLAQPSHGACEERIEVAPFAGGRTMSRSRCSRQPKVRFGRRLNIATTYEWKSSALAGLFLNQPGKIPVCGNGVKRFGDNFDPIFDAPAVFRSKRREPVINELQ